MNIKDIINKIKEFVGKKLADFKGLSMAKKLALVIAIITITLSIIFGFRYMQDSKYQVLFSGLDSSDATTVTKELESKGVEMKIKGTSILVPKNQVDKLRLELSGNISNGSKGFELMDEGSSMGMTDEEFKIKKQRMLQGEIEKTIKTFSQIEDVRVHITNGEESVFAKESEPGSAAVSLTLKIGESLDLDQVRSIISLVSASCDNVPKQNVEVVDQYMNLLSDGLYDENGKVQSNNSNGLSIARKAEKELNSDLERSISSILESMFGKGKVVVKVNADLNFDTNETTEIKIDPNRVALKEDRTTNSSTQDNTTGGNVDNNMNSVSGNEQGSNESKQESIEYETGRTESKTIKAQGEINKVTASVAINGNLDNTTIKKVEDIVSNIIGVDKNRGDSISVVGMEFSNLDGNNNASIKDEINNTMKNLAYVIGIILLIIIGILAYMYINKKKKAGAIEEEFDDSQHLDIINQKIQELEQTRNMDEDTEESLTLEDEVRLFASENKEQVTDLIKSWLSE